MPAPNIRLAVDLSGSVLRVVEGAIGGPMRCGSGGFQVGALVAGNVQDAQAVGQALKQLIARTEITETRALVAVSDAVATVRLLNLPLDATDPDVTAMVAKELPLDPEKLATRWVDLPGRDGQRTVYAAAWDRTLLKGLVDSVKAAGLEPVAAELKSVCVARTTPEDSSIVVDLTAEPAEIILIDRWVPQLWYRLQSGPQATDDAAGALAVPIRSVLRFYRRHHGHDLAAVSPVFISAEQELSGPTLDRLAMLLEHPVRTLPAIPRVPPDVRYATYLTCLGLMMRREL